jgi:hypothetical protein
MDHSKQTVKILDRDYHISGNGVLIHPLLVLTSLEVINNVNTRQMNKHVLFNDLTAKQEVMYQIDCTAESTFVVD